MPYAMYDRVTLSVYFVLNDGSTKKMEFPIGRVHFTSNARKLEKEDEARIRSAIVWIKLRWKRPNGFILEITTDETCISSESYVCMIDRLHITLDSDVSSVLDRLTVSEIQEAYRKVSVHPNTLAQSEINIVSGDSCNTIGDKEQRIVFSFRIPHDPQEVIIYTLE